MASKSFNFVKSQIFILIEQMLIECQPYLPVIILSLQEFINSNMCKVTFLMEFTSW